MQKNRWSRKFDWFPVVTVTGGTSGITYIQKDRGETYNENRHIAVGDIYFKLNKYLTGVTFIYVNSLKDIYNMSNLMTGDGFSLINMYNEYDVINRVLKNIVDVDIAADTNIDLNKQWFSINDVKLKPNQLILLKNQTSPFENDVYKVNTKYFLENAGLLSTREKSDKFSCSVKMGKNIDKQFFLLNCGFDFPITFESKGFVEGQSIILKNLIRYNMYNTVTGTTISTTGINSGKTISSTSKIIFTDYNLARRQLPENYSKYLDFYETVNTTITPTNYITLDYHHEPSYRIRSGSNLFFGEMIGSSLNLNMNTKIGTKLSYSATTTFNWIIGDYVNLFIKSGSTEVLNMNSFIKTGTTGSVCSIYLEDVIPNYILSNLKNCSFTVINLNVASSWTNAYDKFKNYTPYVDFYDASGKTSGNTFKFHITPKDCVYDKYFDYCDLKFSFTDIPDIKYFETKNQYINYTLFNRLNQIDPILFPSNLSVFNSYILSGFTYQYTDRNRIRIASSQTGLTNIFKPYTYVYAFASPSEKTLVYSVKDHEIIIEKPANWTGQPIITAIQNIDGLKNISDILYEVYLNDSYDWYIHKSDNEKRYISTSYGDILASNSVFRSSITGLLFENQDNEFILKLYKIFDENNNFVDPNLYYKTIELVFVGSESTSRLPVPLNLISGTTYNNEDWNVLNDGYHEQSENGAVPDDVLDGRKTQDGRLCIITGGTWNQTGVIGDVFDGGLDVVVPTNNPPLLYNVVDGGFETSSCCNIILSFTTTSSTATVTVQYGIPNYSYYWSNLQESLNNPSSGNTATGLITSVPYSVLVRDGRGCEKIGYITLGTTTTTTTLTPTTTTTTTANPTTTTTTLAPTTTTTLAPTTTTTTLAPTTTTTTTSLFADIYYGKVAGGTTFMPTAAYIKANFNTASGEVGGLYPNPKQYTFNTNLGEYAYFVWKDLPSGSTQGIRAINLVRNVSGTKISPISNSVYKYQQLSPSVTIVPPESVPQTQYYGKIELFPGIWYRVFKSGNFYSSSSVVNVYSIP